MDQETINFHDDVNEISLSGFASKGRYNFDTYVSFRKRRHRTSRKKSIWVQNKNSLPTSGDLLPSGMDK